MAQKTTIFQRLDRAITGNWNPNYIEPLHTNSYDMTSKGGNKVLYTTTNKQDYETTKLTMQQDKFLRDRWFKANESLTLTAFNGLNNVKLMYRDADLMDSSPEIGAALDTYSQEATLVNDKAQCVLVYSQSDRIKSILEDLFVNRLSMTLMAPVIVRNMCKYGNCFMMLDIDSEHGVKAWRELPVWNVERIENGIINPYGGGASIAMGQNTGNPDDTATKFIWMDDNQSQIPFRNWQIGHFRLINNSMYAPYGVSILNAARRSWRELSLMEDMMLMYRLERSSERRVYKVYVGAIDDADVQAYVEQVATNMKRAPLVDPQTGQLDLRKDVWRTDSDIFVPVRDTGAASPIETLPAGNNLTAIDDIKYIQNKMLAALRMPRAFYNFEDAAGEGKNLALMDVRFTRNVNNVQQAFLMELTKIATIHLHLLGFDDELTNFSLAMNNPSTQAEQLEIETTQKKIDAVRDAVSDPGGGIPVMSLTKALKEIMHWSEREIKENFEEIRLEKGIAAELEKTSQIIKKTGIFNTVDRIYGEPGAKYQDEGQGGMPGQDGGMAGGGGMPGGGGADFGSGLDGLGAPGADESGAIGGEEGGMPMADMGAAPEGDAGGEPPVQENVNSKKPLLTENIQPQKKQETMLFENYLKRLDNGTKKKKEITIERAEVYDKSVKVNEDFDKIIDSIDNFLND